MWDVSDQSVKTSLSLSLSLSHSLPLSLPLSFSLLHSVSKGNARCKTREESGKKARKSGHIMRSMTFHHFIAKRAFLVQCIFDFILKKDNRMYYAKTQSSNSAFFVIDIKLFGDNRKEPFHIANIQRQILSNT